MKKGKFLLFGSLVAVSLLATGCGNDKESKLVCTQNQSGVDIEFNIGFKGNVVTDMDFNYDMDLSSYNDTQIEAIGKQDFCTSVKESMSEYKDAFTDCDQMIDESKHLKVNAVLDVDKVAKNALEKMGTPEATKEELEGQGYTCTLN